MLSARSLAVLFMFTFIFTMSVVPALAETPQAEKSTESRLTMIATRTETEVKLDGILDDEVWKIAPSVSGFIQTEPRESAAASEDTEVRIAFDGDSLYIAAYCHDREPDKVIVAALRKDFTVTSSTRIRKGPRPTSSLPTRGAK